MAYRLFVRRFAAVSLSLLFAGCLSPTLPLPPPEPPDTITPSALPGRFIVAGSCLRGAMVVVFDEVNGAGAVIEDRDADGRYEVELEADPCDLGWVEQRVGDDPAARTTFVIQERTLSGPKDPSACK